MLIVDNIKNSLKIAFILVGISKNIYCQNNLIKYQDGNLFGYKNVKTQKIVIQPKFFYAEEFKDGIAIVQEENGVNSNNLSGAYKIIKENGTYISEEVFGTANNLGKGLVVVSKFGNTNTETKLGTVTLGTSKIGLINKEGLFILPCEFNSIGNISDSLIVVSKGKTIINYGVINLKGDYIFPLQDKFKIFDYQCGVAIIKQENHFGLLNKLGKILIEPENSNFNSISKFNKFCIAEVSISNNKYGLINSNGKIIAEPIYTRSSGLSDKGVIYKEVEYNGNGTKK